ncbi:hypothetical protein FA567_30700 [Pseudomonas aeruginosa]|nr:hypothetical protein [Pseudomonas aeruginosa]
MTLSGADTTINRTDSDLAAEVIDEAGDRRLMGFFVERAGQDFALVFLALADLFIEVRAFRATVAGQDGSLRLPGDSASTRNIALNFLVAQFVDFLYPVGRRVIEVVLARRRIGWKEGRGLSGDGNVPLVEVRVGRRCEHQGENK